MVCTVSVHEQCSCYKWPWLFHTCGAVLAMIPTWLHSLWEKIQAFGICFVKLFFASSRFWHTPQTYCFFGCSDNLAFDFLGMSFATPDALGIFSYASNLTACQAQEFLHVRKCLRQLSVVQCFDGRNAPTPFCSLGA